MSSLIRSYTRLFLGFLLGILLGGAPLAAQVDPRLQASPTDFMNLYQQSTSLKAKPEIVTVFDFSGSMASLMFHPLYRNDNSDDSDDYRYMRFQLTNAGVGSPGTPPGNVYYVTARARNCWNAWSQYKLTVNADGTVTVGGPTGNPASCPPTVPNTTAPSYTLRAYAVGNSSAYATVTFTPPSPPNTANPSYNLTGNFNSGTKVNASGSYTITSIAASPAAGPYAAGSTVTLTTYLTHPGPESELASNRQIGWSGGTFGGATWTQVSPGYYKSVNTWQVPNWSPTVATPGDPTQLKPMTVSPGLPFGAGATLNFNTYFITKGSSSLIDWYIYHDGGKNYCVPDGAFVGSPSTASTISGTNVTWKVPAYCGTSGPPTAGTDPYVTVSLDASKGSSYTSSILGLVYPGGLSNKTNNTTVGLEALRKPDGSAVTKIDAAAVAATGLYGDTLGVLDVRNWIRAASHVRFKSGTRTIDIPIPWKITDVASTGNPLSSQTLLDKQVKTSGTPPVTVTYGSNLQIELDTNYKINAGAYGVFASDANGSGLSNVATTNVYLHSVAYRPAYIAWLFNGKYQNTLPAKPNYTTDGSLFGKYIVFDAATATLAAGQTGHLNWGQGYGPSGVWGNTTVPQYNLDGTYKASGLDEASKYKVPALSRVQATKRAAIQTWINRQADVYWAFRFLDPVNEAPYSGGGPTIDNNSSSTLSALDPTLNHVNGNDSGWKVLNNTTVEGINSTTGNSVNGMKRIASMFALHGTPLTYAMSRGLAQYGDTNNVFKTVVDAANVSQCVNHYLLLFTDGIDNNNSGTNNPNDLTPYISGGFLDALGGNKAILANPSLIDRSGANWNLFTFAGIGAHLADTTFGVGNFMAQPTLVSGASGNPSAFLPFAINSRSGVPYDKDHRVTTMTVGVSLGGQYTDPTSPKRSLFLAAIVGDPSSKDGALTGFHAFNGKDQPAPPDPGNDWIEDPQDTLSYPSVGKRGPGAVYFFDATDPDSLVRNLDFAFRLAIGAAGNNSTSSPNLPFIGASFGQQVYIGNFQPPKVGGVVWPGDLLMFGTRETGGTISLTDKTGTIASVLDSSTAGWSASASLSSTLWSTRKLFTRLPGNATVTERGFHSFTDTGVNYTNADNTDNTAGLKNYVANFVGSPVLPIGSVNQQHMIQKAAGGDISGPVDGSGRPTTNRTSIMGDIIDSAPSLLEYTFTDSMISTGISSTPALSAFAGSKRFRLILVGTNQGWLHAFGEVSKFATVTDSSGKPQEIVQGAVAELWSFMPTDFLKRLDYVFGPSSASNPHRFMVNGTPSIYFLDLPPTGGGSGNGTVDNTDATTFERAIAIIGLRKGGRSYYAIDIHDPFNPALKWALVPDEAAFFPSARNLTNMSDASLRTLIANMGFSTCTPGTGRVAFTKGGVTKLRDVVFLGGGYSTHEVESNFLDAGGKTIPMGRSILALDVNTGEVLAASDLTTLPGVTTTLGPPATPSTSSVGPIAAGLVPFEFILNSGMAQRAYFMDYQGALWAWGSKGTLSAGPTKDYRVDTSDLAKWTVDGSAGSSAGIRKVFQDGEGNGAMYTTLPAPFRVGAFPGKGNTSSNPNAPSPASVGIALVSGDRNNPLDDYTANLSTKPAHHRLTLVFDRQDSRTWSLDTQAGPDTGIQDINLKNFSANIVSSDPSPSACTATIWKDITPGCADFYLAPSVGNPYFGYYLDFPSISAKGFIPKGINTPMVVAGSLFYTYFNPTTANPCTGGTGVSYSNVIADVISPLAGDTRIGINNLSGNRGTWSGVASDYIAFGTRGVIQGGTVGLANPQAGGVQTTIEMRTLLGSPKERFPKARVWRTVR